MSFLLCIYVHGYCKDQEYTEKGTEHYAIFERNTWA